MATIQLWICWDILLRANWLNQIKIKWSLIFIHQLLKLKIKYNRLFFDQDQVCMISINQSINQMHMIIKLRIIYPQIKMDIESVAGLSAKSRGILYHLKNNLKKHKKTLQQMICQLFSFRKESFKLKQFQQVIKKYDSSLSLQNIDQLFDELDQSKNGRVFFSTFQQALNEINELDNPIKQLDRRSKIKTVSNQQAKQYEWLIKFKDSLISTQFYQQIVEMFSTQQKGYLNKQNFEHLLDNFGYEKPEQKQIAAEIFFKKNSIVSIKDIFQKLGLENDCMRMSVDVNDDKLFNKKSQNKLQESQYIKQYKQQNKVIQSRLSSAQGMRKSKMNETMKSFHYVVPQNNFGFVKFEDIPQSLQPYFNYGSQLEQVASIIAADYIQNKQVFLDDHNPSFSKATGFIHIAEVCPHYQIYNKAKSVIDRNRKGLGEMFQPRDIIQGSTGDCYFLSALAAVVEEYPELVYRLFVFEKNPSHIFAIRLFIDGAWKTFIMDGILPVNAYGQLCAAQPHHNQIWVILLEKAWAKEFGSYDKIHSGFNQQGLVSLSGAPTFVISSRQPGVLKRIQVQFTKGSIITCSTSQQVVQLSQRQQEQIGVFSAHAYSILKTYIDLPYKNGKVTLLKVRNPWGKKGWKKDWSYKSSKWTKQLRQIVNFVKDPQDGTFFISYEDFVVYFDNINISKVNLGYMHTWVTNPGNRYQFYQNRLTIQHPGDYFFTVYQENPRRYRGSIGSFNKCKSYLFLAKIQKQTENGLIKSIKTIACNAKAFKDNTIQTTLEPGNYILLSNVAWSRHQQHPYNLTSYGPGKVAFSQGIISENSMITAFIQSRSQQILNQGSIVPKIYEHYQISKSVYCSISQGIGFINISNFDNVTLQTMIQFNPCTGLHFLEPYKLPLQLTVFPLQTIVVTFLVNPQGYNFQSGEKYMIHR